MPPDEFDDRRPTDDEYDPGFEPRPRRRPAARRGGTGALAWFLGGCGCLTVLACGGLGGLAWWALKPTDFPEQAEDYAAARKAFRTRLTSTGPSPQPFNQLDPPPEVDVVEYQSGGLTLTAWASKPPADGGKQPAVLYLHSGHAFDERDWDETEPLRKAGFAVLVPLLRGENGQPGSFTMYADEVADCLGAADALAARPGVDKARLFVAGYSSGGTLAMLTAMADGRFKGCAAISGSPDMGQAVKLDPDVPPPFDPADPREVAIRSPLAWPKSFKCPARLYVGEGELPAVWATNRLAAAAAANGQDVVCEPIPGADHFTVAGPALGRAVAFFQGLR
jgi:dienelactone hydrolase